MKPWNKVDEKLVYDGYRKIVRKTFIMPNGKKADFDIVTTNDANGILALTKDNKVILVRQFRPGTEKFYDEMPAGQFDKDETPLESAKRELLEETGYQGEMEYIGKCVDCAYRNLFRHCFIAKNCKKVCEPKHDENEFIEVIEKPLNEFLEHVRKGLLTDLELAYMALHHLGFIEWKK